jgi:hypothetical protein
MLQLPEEGSASQGSLSHGAGHSHHRGRSGQICVLYIVLECTRVYTDVCTHTRVYTSTEVQLYPAPCTTASTTAVYTSIAGYL